MKSVKTNAPHNYVHSGAARLLQLDGDGHVRGLELAVEVFDEPAGLAELVRGLAV